MENKGISYIETEVWTEHNIKPGYLQKVRNKTIKEVYEEVKRHFQNMVFNTIIQRNIKLSESQGYGKPIVLYDAASKGAVNHLNLAQEIIDRNTIPVSAN